MELARVSGRRRILHEHRPGHSEAVAERDGLPGLRHLLQRNVFPRERNSFHSAAGGVPVRAHAGRPRVAALGGIGGPESIAGRPGRELVFRSIAVVGNYDYILDWRFEQEGAITVAVGATGELEVKPVQRQDGRIMGKDPEGNTVEFGHLVAPNTDGVDHDHFFSFRLDLDVDGPKNNFEVDKLVQYKLPATSARKTIWAMAPKIHGQRKHGDAEHQHGTPGDVAIYQPGGA